MERTSRYSLLLFACWVLAATARDNEEYYLRAQDRHSGKMDALQHRYDDQNAKDVHEHHHHHGNDTDSHHHHHHNGTHNSTHHHTQQPLEILHTDEKNLFEMELRPCSTKGMAMTGLNQDGRCAHHGFDGRSEPICIHVPSFPTFIDGLRVPGDKEKQEKRGPGARRRTSLYAYLFEHPDRALYKEDNFFTLTGQPNKMEQNVPCADDPNKECPIEHWCVSEQAFSAFLDQAGGCRKIGTVLCEATNLHALETYAQDLANGGQGADERMKAALECLQDKCWLR